VAQKLVWEHQFVSQPPIVWNGAAFGPHPDPVYAAIAAGETAAMRSGPFITCTLGELLETGVHDNFVDYAASLLAGSAPGAPASRGPPIAVKHYPYTSSGNASWAAARAAYLPDTINTGETDIKVRRAAGDGIERGMPTGQSVSCARLRAPE
jgi:hypothetical protein